MKKSDLKNGMIVTLRRGVKRVIIGKCLVNDDVDICNILENYNDDLTYTNNCKSEDIMKIEYGGEIIWERVEWDKIPMGTKVKVWDWNDEEQIGRFIYYDDDSDMIPFLVFIKDKKSAMWFEYCEIIKEGEEV